MDEKQQLLQYKQTSDLAILGQLFAPYMPLLYGVCFKYLQDKDRAQDAVMQIFEELIQKLRQHEIDNFKSWLHVYAKNYCLMQLRREKGKTYLDIEEHLYESDQKLQHEDEERWTDADIESLTDCLGTLQEHQAQCVRLFYLEQKCYQEIVEETGFDYNQVKSYIQNGKRNLKICLEKKKDGK